MKRVRTLADAARWLDRAGLALLFPDRRLGLPSLWEAMGRRVQKLPRWDDDLSRLWEWKDELPRRRRGWYGKLFRGKGTLVAPRLLPALCAAAGTPWELDAAETLYSRGLLSPAARRIAAVLRRQGPLPTLALRYAAGFVDAKGNARFKRAIVELERRLLLTHFGAAEEEGAAWPSTIYELVPRAFSVMGKQAQTVSADDAWSEIERACGRELGGRLRRMIR